MRIESDGTVRYYQRDALGSIIALMDESGAVRTQYNYIPFGEAEITGELSDNPSQYTGRENDGTGLYYYRARYYSPELKRFISEDPIGLGGGINFYAYVGNSPMNWVDPYGESYLTPIVILIVAYGGWEAYNAWNDLIKNKQQEKKMKEEYLNYITQDRFDEGIAVEKCSKYNESLKQTLRSIPPAIQATPGHSANPIV